MSLISPHVVVTVAITLTLANAPPPAALPTRAEPSHEPVTSQYLVTRENEPGPVVPSHSVAGFHQRAKRRPDDRTRSRPTPSTKAQRTV